MEIKVLGPGCANCRTLEQRVREATEELGLNAKIEHISDMLKFIDYGLLVTPGLVIDGELKISGRVPTKDEIKELLQAAQ